MGGEGQRLLGFPIEHYPKFFRLLAFPPPGLLVGINRGGDLSGLRFVLYNIGGRGLNNVTTEETRLNGPFAMTLAKIGYCFAMAEYGERNFDAQDIRQLLLGKRDDIYNFVGNSGAAERLTTRHLHGLYIRHRGEWLTVLGRRLITA